MKRACNIAKENLLSFGTCFGKFTKSGKFLLHITALDFLAPYAKVSFSAINRATSPGLIITKRND